MTVPSIQTNRPKLLFNPRVILPFLLLAFMTAVLLRDSNVPLARAQAYTDQRVQDEQIKALQKHLEYNDARIDNLEKHGSQNAQAAAEEVKALKASIIQLQESVWLWKGIIYGFGSLISLLELMQALGLIRYKGIQTERAKRFTAEQSE